MGNSESSLEALSPEEVGNSVRALGTKYENYATLMVENGIDGDFLASIDDQDEMNDMMDELNVSSKIHRKLMTRALLHAKKIDSFDTSTKNNTSHNIATQGSAESKAETKFDSTKDRLISGVDVHLTPTKKRRKLHDGTASNRKAQGKCRVCKKKSTHVCSACEHLAEESPKHKSEYLCHSSTGRDCFATHYEQKHQHA